MIWMSKMENIVMNLTGCERQIANTVINTILEEDRKANSLGESKWISVDERLPEPNVLVLAILDEPCLRLNFPFKEQVLILLRERLPYSVGIVEEWRRPFSSETINYDGRVTHWMPLPEAPKMKGGAE